MAELQESIIDDSWKQSLRSAIIIALTESGQTKNQALEQVGSYYQYYAPAFFYKCQTRCGIQLPAILMTHSTVTLQSTNKQFSKVYYLVYLVVK